MRDRVSHRADERRDRGVPNFIELRERAALDWALPKLHAWAEAERLKAPEHRRPAPEVTVPAPEEGGSVLREAYGPWRAMKTLREIDAGRFEIATEQTSKDEGEVGRVG
jgi:hypothetical protein